MKIESFKRRFIEISREDQEIAISEMKKADVKKDHMRGVDPSKADEMVTAFNELIEWCERNRKSLNVS